MTTNLQATNANSPFDFYSAFLALKHELEKRQVFALYKKSFANAAIRDFGYCLMKLDKKPEQKRLLRFLKGKNGLKQLALDGFEAKDFYFKSDYDTYALLKSKKPSEFILMKVIRCLQEKGIRYTMVRVWEHLCCKKGS